MKVQEKVIVFGPTGNIGSIAATTAHKYGSHVTLAMRNPSKPIPGLSPEDEKAGKYTRVQADLDKPDTVKAAVEKSGAKAAFLYLAFGQSDHMQAAFEALKAGGIEFVVFLSSHTVPDKPKQMEKVEPSNLISYAHTQAEFSLEKTFPKDKYVAIRPGYFAVNVLQQKLGIIAGNVSVFRADATFDYVTPDDMGNVAGNILAKGQRDGQNIVYVFGPDELTQRDAYLKVGKGIGKDMQVTEATDEAAAVESYIASGMPEVVARHIVELLKERKPGDDHVSKKLLDAGRANVEKYAARPGVRFEDWVSRNTDMFSSEISDVATAMPESAPEPEEPEEEEETAEGEEGEGDKEGGKEGEKEGEGEGKKASKEE